MSKSITIAAAACTIALVGGPALAQNTEMTFIMCGGEVREADQKAVDEFMADNSGVNVTIEQVPWGTCQDKSTTLAAAGDPVSIAYMGSRTLKQLAKNGLIVPVTIPSDIQARYQDGVLDTVKYEGKFLAFPHAFSTKALFLNCDLLKQAGLQCNGPTSWDELYSMAKQVKDNTGIAGIGVTGKDFDNTMHQFLNYLYANNGSVINSATNEITLNSDEAIEALEFYGKLVDVAQDGPTAFERSQIKDLFNDGKVAMYIDGPWARGQHNEGMNTNVVPIPAGPRGSGPGTLLITDSLVVFKGSGHEDLATKLAEKLATGSPQYDLDSSWGLTPIMKYETFIDDPYYVGDDYWDVFVSTIPTGGPEPLFVEYKSLQTVMNSMIQGIILKEDSAENLVAIAAEELEEFK